MSTVSDLTVCPQCLAPAEIETDLQDRSETLTCHRCGFAQHEHPDGVTTRHGHGTRHQGTPEFSLVQIADEHGRHAAEVSPACPRVAVRCPPLYRLVFARGEPEAEDTRPAQDWSAFRRWGHLQDALVTLGERPHALEGRTLYTASLNGQPGYRTFEAALEGETLHVRLPGQPAFLLVMPETAYVGLNAGMDVGRG
jgi:Zn ribbon nucleic-acid-binding protein